MTISDNFRFISLANRNGFSLTSSNVPETDYTAWSSGTAYVVGDRAMVAGSTHKNYECVLGHTNKNPTNAANIFDADDNPGGYWIEVGATNRWKAFDSAITDLATFTGIMRYEILLSRRLDAMAFFGLNAGGVTIKIKDPSEPRRNFLQYTQEMTHASWTVQNADVLDDLAVAPDLTLTAERFREDSTTNVHRLLCPVMPYTNGATYTFSVYAAIRSGSRRLRLSFPSAAFGTVRAVFNLTTGAVESSDGTPITGATATLFGSYWRLSITKAATATVAAESADFALIDAAGNSTYLGDGNSAVNIWGAQMETGTLTDYQQVDAPAVWDTTVYTETRLVDAYTVAWDSETVLTDLPGDSGNSVEIIIYPYDGVAQVGEIAFGVTRYIGHLSGGSLGIVDYSQKDTDTFGNVTIIERAFVQTFDATFWFYKENLRQLQRELATERAKPVVIFCSDNFGDWGTTLFGMYSDFDLSLTADPVCSGTLAFQGLT